MVVTYISLTAVTSVDFLRALDSFTAEAENLAEIVTHKVLVVGVIVSMSMSVLYQVALPTLLEIFNPHGVLENT